MNTNVIEKHAPSGSFGAYAMSVMTHEFGHALRLIDNPSTTLASLMKHSRDRVKINSPQPFDINSVRACYK